VTLLFAFAYAWRGEGCTIASALIILGALATACFERYYFKSPKELEMDDLKKTVQTLQDRVGRAELSMGLKLK
jgi:hypothetical protein